MKKHILVATGLYPPDIGGPATYAKMLEGELPKHGIEPDIFPFGTVRHLPKGVRHVVYLWELMKRARKTDIIYALDPVSVGLAAVIVSKLLRKPFIIRLGGDYAWEQGRIRFGLTTTLDEYTTDTSGRPLRVSLLAWVQSFVVRRAHLVIAPSQYLKSIIVTWGVREDRVKVVYSALFPLPVHDAREQIREQLAYSGTVLITAARLTPWKGVEHVIRMLATLTEDRPDLMLIIAGDGEAKESLEEKARQLGVSERVRFVGKLSKEALGAAIKGADVFVYNTSYEGLPHQLLEVMELGVPIVTTNIPGNREVITDGVHGILVSPNDVTALMTATTQLLDNVGMRDRLTQNARLRARDFSQEQVMNEFVELLHLV